MCSLALTAASNLKQSERRERIASLPKEYQGSLTGKEKEILGDRIQSIVEQVQSKKLEPIDILRAYTKVAVKAQQRTNCITEVLVPEAEAWLSEDVNLDGPLAGIPISLKDTVNVKGFDSSVGYSRYVSRPFTADGTMVKILKRAGAVPYVKTALPISLLSFESTNDVWGRCTNPHNADYSPGGSTGGEGALLALGGRIGIGTDVAGSVRAPAHFSGIYSLRCSTGRWPKWGLSTSMAGQEGVPAVASPMTRTLNDLIYFSRSILSSEVAPWELDHTVHPLVWRSSAYEAVKSDKRLRIGVLRTDGVVDPSPACARALDLTASSLRAAGHDVFEIPFAEPTSALNTTLATNKKLVPPPSPYLALRLASVLLNSDGCKTFLSHFRSFESNDAGAKQMARIAHLPAFFRWLYTIYVRYIRRDEIWAGLIENFHGLSAAEQWTVVAQREAYRATWHDWWRESTATDEKPNGMDFLLTVPNATPAVPHDGMSAAVSSCGYTFLFNLLDYSAGVFPVTKVDARLDALNASEKKTRMDANGVSNGAIGLYDSEKMAGLPVGVQLVGRRLEEERVLAGMEIAVEALQREGIKYQLLAID